MFQFQTTVSLFIYLALTVICTAQSTNSTSNYSYDITNSLSDCITNLFHNAEPEQVEKYVRNLENLDQRTFEYEVAYDKEPIHNKLFFSRINITDSRDIINKEKPRISCQFTENKLAIFCAKSIVIIATHVDYTNGSKYCYYGPILYFLNTSITLAKLPTHDNETDNKFSADYTYDKLLISVNTYTGFVETLPSSREAELLKLFSNAIIPLLLDNMNHNEKFSTVLYENFLSQPRKSINLTHPHFLEQEHLHFCFISNVPFYWYNLRNITIKGLSNFYSFSANETLSNATHTLKINNIRGSMTLDYGCDIEKPLELHFVVESILISVDHLFKRANAEAIDYHIIRTALDSPITKRQAAIMMQEIEFATASTLLPSMEIWRNSDQSSYAYDLENLMKKTFLEITEKPDSKSVKQIFRKWIPFNE